MSWSWTLYRYLAVRFLLSVVLVYAALLVLAFAINMMALLNRTIWPSGSTSLIVGMAVLQLPELGQYLLPFAVLFGGVLTFTRMSRSQELVAIRAAGISAWDMLLPPLAVAVTLGVVAVTLVTPVSAKMTSEFAGLEARYIKGEPSQLSVSQNGLWLPDGDEAHRSVIRALHVADQGRHLEDALVFLYDGQDHFAGRIDAKSADLGDHVWMLKDAYVSGPGGPPAVHHDVYNIPTTLTPEQIQEISTRPDAMSFWDLPGFIRAARAAGFSATRFQIYLYSLYALPALFAAMVFMAASFSLRPSREGGVAKVILLSTACGFGVYFFQQLTQTLGISQTVPVLLAATAPAIASILIGMTLLFNQEDG